VPVKVRAPGASPVSPQAVLEALAGQLMTGVPQTAMVLGYDQRTVRAAIELGEIPATRVRNTWRIPVSWLRQQARLDGGDRDAA